MLPATAGLVSQAAEEIICEQALDLIAIAIAKTMQGSPGRISTARSLAVLNIRAAIESRLSDAKLDPSVVAAAAGISIRYANALLAEENTSLYRLIQTRRLARCRRCLEDPTQAHRTISEIAYGWGFSDMTHFARSSRKLTASPRESIGAIPAAMISRRSGENRLRHQRRKRRLEPEQAIIATGRSRDNSY